MLQFLKVIIIDVTNKNGLGENLRKSSFKKMCNSSLCDQSPLTKHNAIAFPDFCGTECIMLLSIDRLSIPFSF